MLPAIKNSALLQRSLGKKNKKYKHMKVTKLYSTYKTTM